MKIRLQNTSIENQRSTKNRTSNCSISCSIDRSNVTCQMWFVPIRNTVINWIEPSIFSKFQIFSFHKRMPNFDQKWNKKRPFSICYHNMVFLNTPFLNEICCFWSKSAFFELKFFSVIFDQKSPFQTKSNNFKAA